MEPIGDRERDRDLTARIAAGEEAALVDAYDRHGDVIYGSVVRFLRDREGAAEVVQETFLALWQHASVFDAETGSLLGWLMRIARNRSIDRLRAAARRPRLVDPAILEAPARSGERAWPGEPGDRLGAPGRDTTAESDDPEATAVRQWTRAVVRASVGALPPAERGVLILAYDGGLTQAEIADRLGLPIGTVKSRTRRALARLRDALAIVPDLVDDPSAASRDRDPSRHPFQSENAR